MKKKNLKMEINKEARTTKIYLDHAMVEDVCECNISITWRPYGGTKIKAEIRQELDRGEVETHVYPIENLEYKTDDPKYRAHDPRKLSPAVSEAVAKTMRLREKCLAERGG